MYTQDFDSQTPIASNWTIEIIPYCKTFPYCPAVGEGLTGINVKNTGYALHSQMAGIHFSQITNPSSTLLFFDTSVYGRNTSDAGTSLPVPGRHGGFNSVCYVDGHTAKK